jgi:hypothetical protein
VVTAVISMAGLRLSHSMQLYGALPSGQGRRVCKIAMYVKFCVKHILYVNPHIFLFLLSLSEFAYRGPTNLNWY